MNWDDNAYLISKNRYSENSIIAEFFTAEGVSKKDAEQNAASLCYESTLVK